MNIGLVEQQTRALVAGGYRVLQAHRFADGEFAHVARLERWAELHGRVLDMGSGTGRVSEIMAELNTTLEFTLVNIADQGPVDYRCSFLNVPEHDMSFDGAMFCFSIGHEDNRAALSEAARLLRSGGVLFIYDMVRVAGDDTLMDAVSYHVGSRSEMEAAAKNFRLDFYMEPVDDGTFARDILGDGAQIFAGTIPAIWRFIRC